MPIKVHVPIKVYVLTWERVSEVWRKDVHLLKDRYSVCMLWSCGKWQVAFLLRSGLLCIIDRIRVHILLDSAKEMQLAEGEDLFPSYWFSIIVVSRCIQLQEKLWSSCFQTGIHGGRRAFYLFQHFFSIFHHVGKEGTITTLFQTYVSFIILNYILAWIA